jgi:hypothetical protein
LDQLIVQGNSEIAAVAAIQHRVAIKLPEFIKYFASKFCTCIVDFGDEAGLNRPVEVVRLCASRERVFPEARSAWRSVGGLRNLIVGYLAQRIRNLPFS